MIGDSELLRCYNTDGSQAAFAKIVERHINLVYSAAWRRTGDAHTAQDITQTVFSTLAREARSLVRHPTLTGWLYTTTRFVAAKEFRQERRRKNRELAASAMNDENSADAPDPDWQRLRPVIDSALDQLNPAEREAVLLRFLERHSFAEIGAAFSLTEDAARMRVGRAMDKLRLALGRSGITSTTAALSIALANEAAVAAPAGFAAAVVTSAVASTGATGFGVPLLMTIAKLQPVIITALALVGAGTALYQYQKNSALHRENAVLESKYREAATELMSDKEKLAAAQKALTNARDEHAELLRLRENLASQKPGAAVVPASSKAALPAGPSKSADQLNNAGRATAAATVETIYWAQLHRSVSAIVDAVVLTPEAKAAAQKIFGALSESARHFFGSPEEMTAAAQIAAADASRIQSLQVIATIDNGADKTEVQIRLQTTRGEREYKFPFRLYADGWKMVYGMPGLDREEAQNGYREMAERIAAAGKK